MASIMAKRRLWLLLIFTHFVLSQVLGRECPSGWFGYSSCKYKCHCTNGSDCNDNGDCLRGSTCEKGWFGPACQYVDLVALNSSSRTPNWLYDNNENTCNENSYSRSVEVALTDNFPFTWLRLLFKQSRPLNLLEIQLNFSNNFIKTVDCRNRRQFAISDKIIDIHCNLTVTISKVILFGTGVTSLCQVYISGGRNVALKQHARRSVSETSRPVDGNIDGNCFHSNSSRRKNWNLSFYNNMLVNRYVIYNRIDCCKEGIQGFEIASQGSLRPYYQSPWQNFTYINDINTFTNVTTMPINGIEIRSTSNNRKTFILHLCEVEIFGDSFCTRRKFGRQCELSCYCANNETCPVTTGTCPSGCDVGYQGNDCNKVCPSGCGGDRSCEQNTGKCTEGCHPGKYGNNCSLPCSYRCDGNCDRNTGDCFACKIGYTGEKCQHYCLPGTYGKNCSHNCSSTCAGNRTCDHFTGNCPHGCKAGYTGAKCEEQCEAGKYGLRCTFSCSQLCLLPTSENVISPCNHIDGTCLIGCVSGYEGLTCSNLKSNYFDLMKGIGIGLSALAVIIITIWCCQKKIKARIHRQQSTQNNDLLVTRQDSNDNTMRLKSDNAKDLPGGASTIMSSEKSGNKSDITDNEYQNMPKIVYDRCTLSNITDNEYENVAMNVYEVINVNNTDIQ